MLPITQHQFTPDTLQKIGLGAAALGLPVSYYCPPVGAFLGAGGLTTICLAKAWKGREEWVEQTNRQEIERVRINAQADCAKAHYALGLTKVMAGSILAFFSPPAGVAVISWGVSDTVHGLNLAPRQGAN